MESAQSTKCTKQKVHTVKVHKVKNATKYKVQNVKSAESEKCTNKIRNKLKVQKLKKIAQSKKCGK